MLSGLRNFFLAFLISLVICGLSAHFIINFVSGADGIDYEDYLTDEYGEPILSPDDDMEFYRFTALIIGIDDGASQYHPRLEFDEEGMVIWAEDDEDEIEGEEQENIRRWDEGIENNGEREADAIILIGINARSREFTQSYLPRDMSVNVSGYTLRLGAVYAEHGAEKLVRVVHSYTGVRPDFYVVIDYGSIITLFDILGRVDYVVPMNMHHSPRPYDYHELDEEDMARLRPEVDLRGGEQRLDGEQIVQLLRFRGYGGNYINEEMSREDTHRSFIQEVVRQKFTFENLGRAQEIYEAVIDCIVETDMTAEDFENFTGLIFSFSEFDFRELEYPGTRSYDYGVHWFDPTRSGAIRFFSDFGR